MSTILLFIDFPGTRLRTGESERNCIGSYRDIIPSNQTLLDLAIEHLGGEDACRIGVLEVKGNRAIPHKAWTVRRYKTLAEVPQGAFYDYRPMSVRDIQEDAEVRVNLPPFVAAFQE